MIVNLTPHEVVVATPSATPADDPAATDDRTNASAPATDSTVSVGRPISGWCNGGEQQWIVLGVWPPSGVPARLVREATEDRQLDGIPCRSGSASRLAGLPDPTPGTYYIVSGLAHGVAAAQGRLDTVCPDTSDAPLTASAGGPIRAVRRLIATHARTETPGGRVTS